MRSVVFLVVSSCFIACPAPPAEGEGEGEGEGEVNSGPILAEVSCNGDDWVEVKNLDEADLDLAAFAVTDDVSAGSARQQPLSGTLAAGQRAVFDITAFGIACTETLSLVEGGRVQDATTLAVTSVGATWSRLPEPIDGSSTFAEGFPTRGAANQALVLSSSLRINEIDCRGLERIELINTGADLDVGGFVIGTDPNSVTGRFILPAQVVPEGGLLVVSETDGVVAGFDFAISCSGGSLILEDEAGAVLDAVVLEETAEAFTFGRIPDGSGAFVATEETLGATNALPAELGEGVFDVTRIATIALTIDGDPAVEVPCTLGFDGDEEVACEVVEDGAGRLRLSLDNVARFRGLEDLVLDTSGDDATRGRAVVAGALFRGVGLPAARVGFANISVDGAAAARGLVVEVVEGRALRRALPSTEFLYAVVGDVGRDLVVADINGFALQSGDDLDRVALTTVATTLAPFRDAPGFQDGAADVMKVGSVLRYLAASAWLADTACYAASSTNWRIHLDKDGQALLLPDNLKTTFGADGPLFAAGSVIVDACRADPECEDDLHDEVRDVDTQAEALNLDDVVDVLRATLGNSSGLDELAARIAARPAEVAARLPPP